MSRLSSSLLLLLLLPSIHCLTKCVRVHGSVKCGTDPHRHAQVKVSLVDNDDDQMGHAVTDENGNFSVEGCGDDFGPWNEPDPRLIIEHRCPEQGHTVAITHRKTVVDLPRAFLPQEQRPDVIQLDIHQEML